MAIKNNVQNNKPSLPGLNPKTERVPTRSLANLQDALHFLWDRGIQIVKYKWDYEFLFDLAHIQGRHYKPVYLSHSAKQHLS